MPRGEVARRDSHRHRGQQCGQQRHEVEELLCPIERLAHLGPARLKRLDAHAPQVAHLICASAQATYAPTVSPAPGWPLPAATASL